MSKDLGRSTAYGYAVSKGYTGTEEEFAELMASYAHVAEDARASAESAEQSSTDASSSAENSEAWAVGKRAGADVKEGDETYHNNAKHYAEEAKKGVADVQAAVRGQVTDLKNTLNDAGKVTSETKNIISFNDVVFEKNSLDDSGNLSTNVARARTKEFLQFNDGLLYISAPQTYGTEIFTYDTTETFVSSSRVYKYGEFVLPVNSNFKYKILVKKSDDSNYDTWAKELTESYHAFNMVENDSVYVTVPNPVRIGALDSSGVPSTDYKRATDTDYVPISEPFMLYLESGFTCYVGFYDENKTFINFSGTFTQTGINKIMIPANAVYYKRVIGNTDTTINADASYNYGARQVIKSNEADYADKNTEKYSDFVVSGTLESMDNENIVLTPFMNLTFEENGFTSQGSPTYVNSARGRTGFIKFESPFVYIHLMDGIGVYMLEYDENKTFIEQEADFAYGNKFIVVDTTHYYRFGARNSANAQFTTWADDANKTRIFNVLQIGGLYKTVLSYVEKNSLSAGQPTTYDKRGRDRNFVRIPSNPLLIKINEGYDCGVYYYDENKEYISAHAYTGKTGIVSFVPPTNAVYLKRMVKNDAGTGYNLGFICGTEILEPTAVTEYIDAHASDETAYLPQYEINEVNRVSSELETIMKPLSLEFAFVTDPHTDTTADSDDMNGLSHIVQSIKRLNTLTVMNTVIGGDQIENITGTTAKQQFLDSCYAFNQAVSALDRTVLKGNHDDNSIAGRTSSKAQTVVSGKEISDEEMFIKWWKPIVNSGIVIDEQNPTGMYGYRDYYSQKIRMIYLNTNDVPYIIDSETGYIKYPSQWVFAYQNRQLNWLCDALKVDNGWGVVICQHNPVELGGENAIINGDIFVGIINAFKNGTHYTATGSTADFEASVDVDFSAHGAREFICCVCGHVHQDISYTSSGFLTIVTQNALPRGSTSSVMIPDTVTENAFDIFSVDRANRSISVIRFGYGGADANRTFTY